MPLLYRSALRWTLPLLVSAIIGIMSAAGWADEFDTLRMEWRDYTTGGTNLNVSDPIISSRVSSAANTANSYWNSMIKTNGRTCLWGDAASTAISAHLTTTYNRLSSMALGWAMTGSSLYGNTNLATDIIAGLDWMYANRYNETKSEYNNWWDWEIGVPLALNNCMVMMYPALSGTQITNNCAAIDKFTPTVTMTGANRVWKAEAVGVRGVLGRNAAKVAAARDGLSDVTGGGALNVFAYVTSGDGFYRDGSFIQHGKHPYTAGYGITLFRDSAKILAWLDGSTWAVTDPLRTNIIRWCYDSYEPMIYYGALPEHLRGREVSRGGNAFGSGHAAINAMLRLAQSAPAADAARLKSMVKYWGSVDTTTSGLASFADIDLVPAAEQIVASSSIVPRGELIGHYQFPSMDRVMHLRPGFGFGLSMFSTRVYNYESINSENWHGWFSAYGMNYLWSSADITQFTDSFWPTVDPYHLPGTTVDLTVQANGANQSKASTQPWVGGAALSNSLGVAGMSLAAVGGSLRAYKSWFMFDDEIVCLGAGITCTSATNVHTTVENRNLHTSANNVFTVNGVTMPATPGWSSNFNNMSWCALDTSGGYYFPGGATIRAQRMASTGKWSDINANGSTSSITRNYLSLIWDHGVAPVNAAYAYVLLPRKSAAEVGQYAANPRVNVVSNSAGLQAVRESSLGILAANFWTDGAKTVDMLTVNRSAAVITRETNGVLEVSVADPTWTNSSSISVSCARNAAGVLSADAGVSVVQLSPLQISVNVSGARGKTFRARFAMATNLAAVADFASTGVSTPIQIDVLANDLSAASAPVLVWVGSAGQGAASREGELVNYVPAAGFSGADTFNYSITDGQRYATGTVSVLVGASALSIMPGQVSCSTFQTGNGPENTVDNDLGTRWSAQGNGQWIQYDLLSTQLVNGVSIAFYSGDTRVAFSDVQLSCDGAAWTQVFTDQSSGTTTNLQRFDFPADWARFVRIVGHGNSASDWNSFTEVRIHTGTNASPVAVTDAVQTVAGRAVDIPALANDYDPDHGPQPLLISSVTSPAHGAATLISGRIHYAPNPAFSGLEPLSYTITDSGLVATGLVTISVATPQQPILSKPILSGSLAIFSASVTAGSQCTIQVSTNLVDWSTLLVTNATANTIEFAQPALLPARFYRIVITL